MSDAQTETQKTIPNAPDHIRAHYAKLFGQDIVEHAFSQLEAPGVIITGNDVVRPMIEKVRRGEGRLRLLLCKLVIMANHNQDLFLHDRMTFHARADIQDHYTKDATFRALASVCNLSGLGVIL
jgi:hypothetical protein